MEEYPHTQILDVNMPQSWIKGFVTNLSTGNLRKTLKPALRYENYFILPGHIMSAEIREQLYCDNQCSGYIYIVDSMGKIRWATSGYATPEDLKLMWKVVKGAKRNDQVKACSSVNSWGVCRKMFTVLIYATSQLGLDYSYNKISVKVHMKFQRNPNQKKEYL